ncbi:MAG: hypothetical protein M1550_03540 [Deltaproteobacteria bacterium]|nr:hypothetical protein [Deltaproteobacteria bacterium]
MGSVAARKEMRPAAAMTTQAAASANPASHARESFSPANSCAPQYRRVPLTKANRWNAVSRVADLHRTAPRVIRSWSV